MAMMITSQGRLASSGFGGWKHAARLVKEMLQVARERRQLAKLDERSLRDLGISESAASFEASRPFWDLPLRVAGDLLYPWSHRR